MTFLAVERRTLDAFLPGLRDALDAIPAAERERPGSPVIDEFRKAGGPALLIPEAYGGLGATPLDAVRVQRAIGASSPGLAVAAMMHHFSVATLVELGRAGVAPSTGGGLELLMLEAVARDRLLVASGFAEGRTGQGIMSPTMTAVRRGSALVVSGTKKPCSLSASMDMLTASVQLPEDGQIVVVVIPAASPGVTVRPFWGNPVLGAAESDEVILDEVEVHPSMVMPVASTPELPLDTLQATGFLWFELLATASYVGVASALVELVLARPAVAAAERIALVGELQAAMAGVEGLARAHLAGEPAPPALPEALFVRYAAQDVIGRVARRCVEALGGLTFVTDGHVTHLASATAALAFHPPSRNRMAEPLCEYLAGHPLRVP